MPYLSAQQNYLLSPATGPSSAGITAGSVQLATNGAGRFSGEGCLGLPMLSMTFDGTWTQCNEFELRGQASFMRSRTLPVLFTACGCLTLEPSTHPAY